MCCRSEHTMLFSAFYCVLSNTFKHHLLTLYYGSWGFIHFKSIYSLALVCWWLPIYVCSLDFPLRFRLMLSKCLLDISMWMLSSASIIKMLAPASTPKLSFPLVIILLLHQWMSPVSTQLLKQETWKLSPAAPGPYCPVDHQDFLVLPLNFFFFFFLGLHPWRMEVPRLGVESELQLLAYSYTRSKPCLRPIPQLTAILDPQPTEWGQGSNLRPHDASQIRFLWATAGTPTSGKFLTPFSSYSLPLP